jgi:hypothetical protein
MEAALQFYASVAAVTFVWGLLVPTPRNSVQFATLILLACLWLPFVVWVGVGHMRGRLP